MVRERAALPSIWHQPLNQRAIEVLRNSGIECAIPAQVIGALVRGDWLAPMAGRVRDFIRARDGELQIRRADLEEWVPMLRFDLWSRQSLSDQGVVRTNRACHNPLLSAAPINLEEAGFPASLRQHDSQGTYIGRWTLDTPRPLRRANAHQGVLIVDKQMGLDRPTTHFAGFQFTAENKVRFHPLDRALRALASGRHTASCSLFKVGSLALLHRIEALLQQEHYPRASVPHRQDQQADQRVAPLWNLPVERRFPALVHQLISGTERNANQLMEALHRVSQRRPEGPPGSLTVASVIALAAELAESTYPRHILAAIHCRFLAHRVMRVAHALLDLRRADELEGHTIASVQISRSERFCWLMRLLIGLSDILGWFAERLVSKQPLPEVLVWRSPAAGSLASPRTELSAAS